MEGVIYYILNFLTGNETIGGVPQFIGYTSDPMQFHKYKIVIIPSHFFDEAACASKVSRMIRHQERRHVVMYQNMFLSELIQEE